MIWLADIPLLFNDKILPCHQILISHYATRGVDGVFSVNQFGSSFTTHRVIVFTLTVNNDWSQIQVAQHNILR